MKRVLFIRSDRFGEFLLALPAMRQIKAEYPDSRAYLLAQKANIDLVKGVSYLDEFIEYSDEKFSGFFGSLRLAEMIRKEKIDTVVIFNPKKDFHLAAWLSGAPIRIGYDRKLGFLLNKKIIDHRDQAAKHEVEHNLDLADLICQKRIEPKVELRLDDQQALGFLKDRLDLAKKYLVLHPFTSNPVKKVDGEFWRKLIAKVSAVYKNRIVVVGSAEEEEQAKVWEKKYGLINLAGKLNLRQLADFFKYNCDCFIGLDSGPMHLAAAFDIPLVGIFTVSKSRRWGPFSRQGKAVLLDNSARIDPVIEELAGFLKEKNRL